MYRTAGAGLSLLALDVLDSLIQETGGLLKAA